VYDPAEDSWTAIASMMVPRCEFGLCAVDGRLYAFGGWVGEDIGQPVFRIRIRSVGSVTPGPGSQKFTLKKKTKKFLGCMCFMVSLEVQRILLLLGSPSWRPKENYI
jgi:hypothetical protein